MSQKQQKKAALFGAVEKSLCIKRTLTQCLSAVFVQCQWPSDDNSHFTLLIQLVRVLLLSGVCCARDVSPYAGLLFIYFFPSSS